MRASVSNKQSSVSLPVEKNPQTRKVCGMGVLWISSSALLGEWLLKVWGSLEGDRDGSLKVSCEPVARLARGQPACVR